MMYSPVVVAGSNTHNYNMPQKKQTGKQVASHRYNAVRETLLVDASATTPVAVVGTANSTAKFVLAPLGIKGLKLASGPTISTFSYFSPKLRWLLATAFNFKQYRVLRAKIVVVGGQSSTATGSFNITSSGDVMDIFGATTPSFATGPPGTSVASLASGDKSFPLTIDTSWKHVSNNTAIVESDQVSFIGVHNVGDLSFCTVAISNNSLSDLGICYLDYDIEFRGPINNTING